ncbi:hypothetical protein, partial [Vibrio cortegadensis]|uniref:hypothetical protein n=1 Tax=Vibrio cortegadensis TaxID=1328770 RepID=UPI00352DE74A
MADANGNLLEVDCSITFPMIVGQNAEINISIPNSIMPIRNVIAPFQIEAQQGTQKVVLDDVYYRSLTTQAGAKRKLGSHPIKLSHVKGLTNEMNLESSSIRLSVFLSETTFFETLWGEEDLNGISRIAMFDHPTLGSITLQKYTVESSLLNSNGSLKQHGYCLEVERVNSEIDHEGIIDDIQPLLDILSLVSRQRVLVLGWEKQTKSKNIRHWRYPLDVIRTSYSLDGPQSYLVSGSTGELEKMVNSGLSNYYNLDPSEQDIVHKLSFNLCSSLQRRDDVKYMVLFTALESYAKKLSLRLELDATSSKSIQLIKEAAKPHQNVDHDVYKKLMSLTHDIKKTSAADSIKNFLFKHRVFKEDLWSIQEKGGLLKIRDHLAHEGNHNVDHQGLAVATLHLTILIERVILGVLNLKLESSVQRDLRQEPWLNLEYANRLKNLIIQKT